MADVPHGWTDHEIELVISRLLRIGVSVATAVVVVGGLLYLARHGREVPQLASFHGEPAELHTLGGVLTAAWAGEARAIIQLGLGFLIATPVARVAFSLYAFLRQRDALYVAITGAVLIILLLNLFSS